MHFHIIILTLTLLSFMSVMVHIFAFVDVLQRDGHAVELVKINDRNAVELWVNGELVFDCNIATLEFGTQSFKSLSTVILKYCHVTGKLSLQEDLHL